MDFSVLRRYCKLFLLWGYFAGVVAGESPQHYWFFFIDKGPNTLKKAELQRIERSFSDRVRQRRAKMATMGSLADETDLPVYLPYLEELAMIGIRPRTVSKWLNAVAAAATAEQMAAAKRLSCITEIKPVGTYHRPLPQQSSALEKPLWLQQSHDLDYGPSITQNQLIQIPEMHRLGYYGQGVRIAVFDTGFRLNHEVFDSLRLIAQYDFINRDDYTDLEPEDDPQQNRHGSMVLSLIAGYAPGRLIGPAFRAEYLLAKTEDTGQEIRAEEDHWIAAAEWADSMGADIITSSLGYNDWYTYADMDGATAPITIAADLAVSKGIVVCTSAGNEGNSKWRHITAPADGKYVIAVGAVTSDGTLASFSSRGPTADGRIKPDVVAMGVGLISMAVPPDGIRGTAYTFISGTSASCPMAAGAAALLLCAFPQLAPLTIRQALWLTATLHDQPNNDYGYGLLQAATALAYCESISSSITLMDDFYCLTNPFRVQKQTPLSVAFALPTEAVVTINLFNLLGQELGVMWHGYMTAGNKVIYLHNSNQILRTKSSGIYFLQLDHNGHKKWTKFTVLP